MKDDYSDIINLPHPVSKRHPQMPMINRAAQFAPFAALTGYEAAIDETARLTDDKAELDEENQGHINEKLKLLRDNLAAKPEITVVYFQPDDRKSGGSYVTHTGIVKKIDDFSHLLFMEDGTMIHMGQLMELEGDLFSVLE